MTCGGGDRSREVMCFSNGKKTEKSVCDPNDRPFNSEQCNQNPCDDGKTICMMSSIYSFLM